MILQSLYVFLCFIMDMIINDLLPFNYAASSMIFVPSLGFCALILITRKMDLIEAFIFTVIVGFIYGLFIPNSLLLYPILFTFAMFLTRIWSVNLNDTLIEILILCLLAIFVKDFSLYLYMKLVGITVLSLIGWVRIYLFIAIIGHIIPVIMIILLYRQFNNWTNNNQKKKLKKEHIIWNK